MGLDYNHYNYGEKIEEFEALVFRLLMSDEVVGTDGPNAAPLWDIVGSTRPEDAEEFIARHERNKGLSDGA